MIFFLFLYLIQVVVSVFIKHCQGSYGIKKRLFLFLWTSLHTTSIISLKRYLIVVIVRVSLVIAEKVTENDRSQ